MMKRTISIFMLGIAVMLASCSRDEDALQSNAKQTKVTFTATLDGSMNLRAAKNRSVTDPTDEAVTRAVLEIYEGGVMNIPRITGTIDGDNITFTAELEEGTTYTCLFWADGGEQAYDIHNLLDIKRGANPSVAYYARETITASAAPVNVTLTHAVAKVVLHETGTLAVGDEVGVSFTMPAYTFSIDMCDVVQYGPQQGATTTIAGSFDITSETANGQVGWLYVFAPDGGADPVTMTLSYTAAGGSKKIKQVSNVPLKPNHRTVLKGEFANISGVTQSFNVTLDKNWDDDSDVYYELSTTAAVGDYYYEGGLFSDTYYSSPTCLGVVFYTENGGQNGKVVGMQENSLVAWSNVQVTTNATDMSNGLANMRTIYNLYNDFTDYPAFAWVHSLNPPDTDYNDPNAKGVWYLPAKGELQYLLCAATTDILDFETWEVGLPSFNQNNTVLDLTAFNSKLTAAGGAELNYSWHQSSSENATDNQWLLAFEKGNTMSGIKTQAETGHTGPRARCILAF